MAKQRFIRTKMITVEECDWCGEPHDFPIEVVFDREMDAIGWYTIKTEIHKVVVTCPSKHKPVVVPIPVNLDSLETFVNVRPGG